MTLDEQRRLALLEATLREIRRIARQAEHEPQAIPFDDALEGELRDQWKRTMRQIDLLLP